MEIGSAVYNEKIHYQNPLLCIKVFEITDRSGLAGQPKQWNWHYHKEVEFLAIKEGALTVNSKDEMVTLGPGDVILLGSSQLHRTKKAEPADIHYIVLQFDMAQYFDQSTMPYMSCFSELHYPLNDLNYIFRENASVRQDAFSIISDILVETQTKAKGYEIAISALIKRMLLLLLRNDRKNIIRPIGDTELVRLQPALEYIEQHLADKISIGEVSDMLNLSYHYFIKYFKKVMGMSFVDFVNYKRIKKAERLILTRDVSIAEVGESVGIPNMAQFYKMFKRCNQCSPKEFKLKMKGEALQR
ncbi:helix-turn-helix domain-containing protein [Paenibacillus thalictri]|uniref:AraC family transcriptional regulator n=1 Tax=Paenibacillus thalictri TaxID=2527873 RepID=A0A4Q9DE41_9BACL|nr:AraC family transcriptional regulator [Paenibacillus thalictri]TBL68200.1 AraC family transcriptional regulator [Paenibacillus thalictri]